MGGPRDTSGMDGYSRRLVLQLGGIAVAGAFVPEWGAGLERDSFALLRRRWRDVTAGSGFDAGREPYRSRMVALGNVAARYRDGMALADTSLWPGLPFPSLGETPARLRSMARAYVLPGTGVTGDARLGAAVAAGIDHFRQKVYAEGADPVGNWWDWQIGAPKKLLDAAVLVGEQLTDLQGEALTEAVDHFVPESVLENYSGISTGAVHPGRRGCLMGRRRSA